MGNRKKKDKPEFKVIFNGPYVPTDIEEVCMLYFGVDFDTFAEKVLAGDFDYLMDKQPGDSREKEEHHEPGSKKGYGQFTECTEPRCT